MMGKITYKAVFEDGSTKSGIVGDNKSSDASFTYKPSKNKVKEEIENDSWTVSFREEG